MSAFTEPSFAWEPVTPRGVAAFARASFERLFVVQSVVALLAAAAVVWVLADGIFPTVDAAIATAGHGRNHATANSTGADAPQCSPREDFLAISVDLKHSGTLRSPAQISV